jgi:hypothetical protein
VRRVCEKFQVPQDARTDDPGARSSTRKGARNRSQKAARFPSLGRSDPWPVRVVARGPPDAMQVASDTPTQPASLAGEQRSESPARARGSDARRVCPRVVYGCRSRQAMSRAQRSASPLATGRVDGGSARANPKKARAGPTASIAGVAVAKPRRRGGRSRALERASRGEGPCPTEDTPGRRSEAHRFTRALRAAILVLREKGDRGVRGSGAR